MKKQKAMNAQLLRMIAMVMVLIVTITCMDLNVLAIALNEPQETTARVETEIEASPQINGVISSKTEFSKITEMQEINVKQEKIDSSLLRDDPLADKVTKKQPESIPAPVINNTKSIESLPKKAPENLEKQNKPINENNDDKVNKEDYEPGVVVVGFKQSYTKSKIVEEFPQLKIKSTEDQNKLLYETVKSTSNYKKSRLQKIEEEIGTDFVIKLKNKTKKGVTNAIKILKKNDNVEYAVPNYVVEPTVIPNDDRYPSLWGMKRIQAPQAWDTYTGNKDVTVGIIDSGIDASHPDLAGNINTKLAYNAHKKIAGNTMDNKNHGTNVAGIVGAIGNNADGITGVNWNINMVPIKISHDEDELGAAYATAMAEAVRYAIEKEIPICNMSYGIPAYPPLIEAIKNYNGLFVVPAGNEGKNIDESSQYSKLSELENVIIVASSNANTGEHEELSDFSSYGVKNVDIAAPGEGILCTVPGGTYESYSGTSLAAPYVTGVAALIKGKYPNLTTAEIKDAILLGVDRPVGIVGLVSTGRLNAFKAINRISDSTFLEVRPNDNEELSDAIRRSLGTKVADNITYLKISGNANMAAVGDGESSANVVLPNLEWADLSGFTGLLSDRAFANCGNLTTVISPPNDFSLRACSFWYCTKLKTIYRANSKEKIIGEADFTGMSDAGSSENPYAARVQCFQGCTSLTTIKMPNTHKIKFSIYVFNGCKNLLTIYLAGYPRIIGEADLTEFENISEGILRETGIRTVKLPKDVAISGASFANCVNLTNVQFHPNQTVRPAIGQDAFSKVNSSCVVYTNQLVKGSEPRIVIPRSDTEIIPIEVNSLVIQPITDETMGETIDWYLDSRNPNSIKHLVVKGSATMGYGTGANILPELETVDLSEFTGSIEKGVFYDCFNLKQVIYPAGNDSIPAWSYVNCSSLQTIQVADKYPKIWGEIDLSNIRGTVAINTQAFENCVNIETVKLPSTEVIGIAPYAFNGCSKLSTVYKDGDVKIIKTADLSSISNFWSGTNFDGTFMEKVILPKGVDIPKETFANCIVLEFIMFDPLQTSAVNIGTNAFYNLHPLCKAYMNKVLVENSAFILKRSDTKIIPKVAY